MPKLSKSLHHFSGLFNKIEKINVTLMQYLIVNIYEMQKNKYKNQPGNLTYFVKKRVFFEH